jgi:hypothetical protein
MAHDTLTGEPQEKTKPLSLSERKALLKEKCAALLHNNFFNVSTEKIKDLLQHEFKKEYPEALLAMIGLSIDKGLTGLSADLIRLHTPDERLDTGFVYIIRALLERNLVTQNPDRLVHFIIKILPDGTTPDYRDVLLEMILLHTAKTNAGLALSYLETIQHSGMQKKLRRKINQLVNGGEAVYHTPA